MASTQQVFLDQLLHEDDIAWKAIILDAVRNNQMDPWDIDIAFIATQFVGMLSKYKEMNFKISGKVVLASAILLRLKSRRFISHEMSLLDQMIASVEQSGFDDVADIPNEMAPGIAGPAYEPMHLFPRTPQPRKRKVSVYDLIDALEKALEVNQRRQLRTSSNAPSLVVPTRLFDINLSITHVYSIISRHYLHSETAPTLTFAQLIPSQARNDKIFTFIPLLHLRNMQKIDLHQEVPFADFGIELFKATTITPEELSAQK